MFTNTPPPLHTPQALYASPFLYKRGTGETQAVEPRAEPRAGPRVEPRAEPRVELRVELRAEVGMEARGVEVERGV